MGRKRAAIGLRANGPAGPLPLHHHPRKQSKRHHLPSLTSRLAKETILTNAFRVMLAGGATPGELEAACFLLSPAKSAQQGGHRLQPDWVVGRPLAISHKSIVSAVCEVSGVSRATLRSAYWKDGDLGMAAEHLCRRCGRTRCFPAFMATT